MVVGLLSIWLLSLTIFSFGYSSILKTYNPYGTVIYYIIIADSGVFFSIAAISVVVFFVTEGTNKRTIDKISSKNENTRNVKSIDETSSGVLAYPYKSGVITPQSE